MVKLVNQNERTKDKKFRDGYDMKFFQNIQGITEN